MSTDARITVETATAIATAIGPWAVVSANPESYDDGRYQKLVYTGPDPLLADATLDLHAFMGPHNGILHCDGGAQVQHGEQSVTVGRYLDPADRDALNTSINVSLSKAPTQIAKDITRRLLPAYTRAFRQGRLMLAHRTTLLANRQDLATKLADLAPGARLRQAQRLDEESILRLHDGPDLRISSTYVCTSGTFSMSPAQAALFLALVASPEWQRAKSQ